MATKPERIKNPFDGRITKYRWTLGAGETGDPVRLPIKADKTVQIHGTPRTGAADLGFFGATVRLTGTLYEAAVPGAAEFRQLRDPHERDLTKTADDLKAILENCEQYRPEVTGGDVGGVTKVEITLLAVEK